MWFIVKLVFGDRFFFSVRLFRVSQCLSNVENEIKLYRMKYDVNEIVQMECVRVKKTEEFSFNSVLLFDAYSHKIQF